ncbi:uncharacterized protein LOC119788699 [Cyprinodon tularosa]|uniref:uncharacterized protein LOC119788699 n=1 Tax=Cyprinodon tularosa TaxID=77115 RepID=UPI0018E22CF2|nr:uncharacterized protein LOC119788699 [Cyprinodon tularosa]
MSVLLKEIRMYNSNAAIVLEKANFCSDSEIQSLTRIDLNELFPGPEKLKLRRSIFEKINKQKPIEKVLQDLRSFIPEDSIKDALSSGGVLVDYLHVLKDTHAQLSNVQHFLEAHISLLEDIKGQPQQKHQPGSAAKPLDHRAASRNETALQKPQDSFSGAGNQSFFRSTQSNLWSSSYGRSQVAQVMVKFKMVVGGKTFDAHLQILDKLRSSTQQLMLVESQNNEDCQMAFVFCPVVSRVGTDVEAAMKLVTGDMPVILVLMHHTHEAKPVTTMGTWECNSVMHHVNVFYHEKARGLITCKENDNAISDLQNVLLKRWVNSQSSDNLADTNTGHNSPSGGANYKHDGQNKKGGLFSSLWP